MITFIACCITLYNVCSVHWGDMLSTSEDVQYIFKSERKDDLNNYRPITVLPTVARVMERLTYKKIYNYFNTEKLLNENQWGFSSLHSTVLALSDCSSDWLFIMDKGIEVDTLIHNEGYDKVL